MPPDTRVWTSTHKDFRASQARILETSYPRKNYCWNLPEFWKENSTGPSNLQIILWKCPSVVKTTWTWEVNKWLWGGCITSYPFGAGSLSCEKQLSPIAKKSTINQLARVWSTHRENLRAGKRLQTGSWETALFLALSSILAWPWPWECLPGLIFSDITIFIIHDLEPMYTWSFL